MTLTRIQKIGIAGGCMLLLSILLQTAILPSIIKSQVKKKVALKKGWMMRDIWGKFPFAFEFRIYMFNVTNPDGIKTGEKPILKEIGPYIYDEWQEKVNQIDHEEDDSVSYALRKTYYFNKEKSNGLSDEEELVIPHIFILGLINTILQEKPAALPILSKAIDSIMKKPESIFIKTKVKTILFDGLIIDCNVQDFSGSATCNEIQKDYEKYRLKKMGENMYSVSIFGFMNATDSKARTRVYRGIKNIMDVGKVTEYNGKPNISVWNNKYCDTFNGTDGTIFHPFFDKNGKDDVVAFNPDLCRSISCHFESKTTFSGMKLLRYTSDLGTDGENNPRHKCYCSAPDNCPKKGTFDLYKCNSAPIIITNPHFYLADPYYLSLVEGLKPKKEKHMIIVDIDPFTGMPINVHTRAQFNLFIGSLEKLKLMKNYPEALLPFIWMDQIINLPDDLLQEIKSGHKLVTFSKIFKYLVMISGLGMSLYAGIKRYLLHNAENKLNVKVGKQKLNFNNNNLNKTMNINTITPAPMPLNVD